MNITDYAYITSVKDIAFRPALEILEAAMLPAQSPHAMGALGYLRRREKACWQNMGVIGRKSGSGKRGPAR